MVRATANPTPFIMIRRLLPFLVIITLVTVFSESAHAWRLSNSELRRFGFAGTYRGVVEGDVLTRDGDRFLNTVVSQSAREVLPVPNRDIVTGPTRRNGFFLVLRDINGNKRRLTVRMYYSGKSYNPIYKEEMAGSGFKTLRVTRISASRPRFEMLLTDEFSERAVNGGAYYSTWDITGRLYK